MKTPTKTIAMLAAAVLTAGPPLLADTDLNTFLHGGTMARPLAATTTSDEAILSDPFDAMVASRADATLGATFDSWWQFIANALINGPFSSFDFPTTIILR